MTREKKMAMANGGYDARSVIEQEQEQEQGSRSWYARVVHKLERWSFLYNVTTGLYMLDGWERCLCNVFFLALLLGACYNGGLFVSRLRAWCGDVDDLSAATSQWFDSIVGSHHLRTALGALAGGPRRN